MTPENQRKFMQKAIEIARLGVEKGQSPFGACIVTDGRIIAYAHNTVVATHDPTAHAEVNAIRKACQKLKTHQLSGFSIFSTCEPCPMCFSAIHWAKIDKIIYGASISDAKSFGFSELELSNKQIIDLTGSKMSIQPGYMAAQCLELFEYWHSKPDKSPY